MSWDHQLECLRNVAQDHDLTTIVLSDPLNLSWLTGARWHVPQTLSPACFDLVIEGLRTERPNIRVVTNSVEAPRLRDTEFTRIAEVMDVGFDAVGWDEDRSERIPSGAGIGGDVPSPGRFDVAAAVAGFRRVLSPGQIETLADVCSDAAGVVGRVAKNSRPGQSEYEIGGDLLRALLAEGLECVALFVGADDRPNAHRHSLPTGKRVESRVTVSCCARRNGLVASITRIVNFTTFNRASSYQDLLRVEQSFLENSRPGANLGEVFDAGMRSYRDNGFDPEEWRRHHQGGLTGFNPRELIVSPRTDLQLAESMVLGWNPTADGLKVEDTSLVTAAGAVPLGHDPDWPAIEVGGISRPAVLELN